MLDFTDNGVTATQAMYDLFCNYAGNETTALELADSPGLINSNHLLSCLRHHQRRSKPGL